MTMHLLNDVDGNAEVKGQAKTKKNAALSQAFFGGLICQCLGASRGFDKTKYFSAFYRLSLIRAEIFISVSFEFFAINPLLRQPG